MHQIKDDYDDPQEVLRVARLAVKEANNRALRLQNQTTQQLVQRVKDLKYWSGEIDRELQDLKDDNEDIVRYFRRLQSCAGVTQDAVKCNEACFAVRRKRIHVDSHDRVDGALTKEKDVISDCVKQMKEFNGIIEKQLEINEAKYIGRRANASEFDYRDTVPLQRMSEYQEWIENTALNLNNSAKAMRQEAVNVENTLKDSIRNWTEWRDSLQGQLNAKDKEMRVADAALNELQYSLSINGSPLQVALMRQNQRGLRPGIELCNDKAQHALQIELNNLKSSMLSLEHQLDKAKESRKKLDGERYRLERKLEICQQNVAIDYEVLRQIRTTYPQEIQLSGFLVGELPKSIGK
ncbi:hypothetical protein M3Y99_01295400 [Aphelenchoides fujianensis]|nr:hypothetical protein M3Y99_01295400 [Aphelenchoides fujianensis]